MPETNSAGITTVGLSVTYTGEYQAVGVSAYHANAREFYRVMGRLPYTYEELRAFVFWSCGGVNG